VALVLPPLLIAPPPVALVRRWRVAGARVRTRGVLLLHDAGHGEPGAD